MKKNLALILVLALLATALLGVIPTAEETSSGGSAATAEKYTPEITYANVNYIDSIYMMFAVPVPATLEDGASVKVIVWETRDDSIAFSYNDIIKDVLEPETEKATIDGVEHYVFTYDALDADQMTNVFCARPVVVKDDVATSYGKVIDYSILEYVASAKGDIDGIAPITDADHIDALNKMLDFGALAQGTASTKKPAYYANDELLNIYVTPVINGVAKDRLFAGFFKYEEGVNVSVVAPFFDGTNVVKITDAEGNALADLDDFTDGFQINSNSSDLELTVYYENVTIRSISGEYLGPDLEINNNSSGAVVGGHNGVVTKKSDYGFSLGTAGSCNFSGIACVEDTSSLKRMNYWHSIKTVPSPDDPDDLVLQFTGTCTPAFNFTPTNPADFSGVGFGDTIYPAFTFEMTLGAVNGKMPTTGKYYFRHRLKAESVDSRSYIDLHIFTITNGEIVLASGDVVGKIPETGMAKFALTIDALTGMTYGYAEDENGVMQPTCSGPIVTDKYFKARQQAHLANLADDDPSNDQTLAFYENIYNFFTKAVKLEPTFVYAGGGSVIPEFENASIEINGVMTPIKNADGTFNFDAVKALAERDYSFLIDDFRLTMGFLYE